MPSSAKFHSRQKLNLLSPALRGVRGGRAIATCAEADPAEQALHEAVALAQLPQRRQRARRQQAEVAGVGGDRRARQAADHAIERVRGGALEPAFALACQRACRARRRSPRATCATNCGISSGGSWPSASRISAAPASTWSSPAVSAASLPKLRDRRSSADARIGCGERLQHLPGGIAAAVVDVQHAAVDAASRASASSTAREPRMQQRQGFGLVVGGDDDGQAVVACRRSSARCDPCAMLVSRQRQVAAPPSWRGLALDRALRGAARTGPACAAS